MNNFEINLFIRPSNRILRCKKRKAWSQAFWIEGDSLERLGRRLKNIPKKPSRVFA